MVFDLDDTLYPEAEYVKSGFRMCAKILKRKCYDEEAVAKELTELFDENPVDVFNRYIEKYGMTGRTLEDCVRTYRIHEPKINLSSEAASILAWLKENGILAGLLTDGRPEGQRAKIKALKSTWHLW